MASAASAVLHWPTASIPLRRVLLATDFSAASENALRCAAAIARLHGAKLYLAHVVSSLGFTLTGPEAEQQAMELAEREALELEVKLAYSGALGGFGHEVVVRRGCIWDELQSVVEKESIDLLVAGTHGRGGLGKLVLGSVAEEIFRHASCPVLTVGPCSPAEWSRKKVGAEKTVLFATDFGPACDAALPYAISAARQSGAKLLLLHVEPFLPEPMRYWYMADDVVALQSAARSRSLEQLRVLVPDDLKQQAECRVAFGFPGDHILALATSSGADLIVLGLQRVGHGFPAGHLPQSTAYAVVCGAACPVLTVRIGVTSSGA